MATLYRPSLQVIYIDLLGRRVPVPSETFDVDIVGGGSLGTISSDADGFIDEGSHTATAGDVIEISHATYPGVVRFALQATQELAYTAAENDAGSYIVQNDYTTTNQTDFANLWMSDLDNPAVPPKFLTRVPVGTSYVPYQTAVGKDIRLYLIPQDVEGQFGEQNFDLAEFEDEAVPGTSAGIDGSGAATRIAYWSDADTLTSDSVFVWDATNDRLGVGTGSPNQSLEVVGRVRIDRFLQPWIEFAHSGTIFAYMGDADGILSGGYTQGFAFRSNNGVQFSSSASPQMSLDTSGNLGVGISASIAARAHFLATTEQLRIAYDTSNYLKATVGSAGETTIDGAGSSKGMVFASGMRLTVGGARFIGFTSSASAPSTTEYPNDKDWGFHDNTAGGANIILAFNDGGTIRTAVLS